MARKAFGFLCFHLRVRRNLLDQGAAQYDSALPSEIAREAAVETTLKACSMGGCFHPKRFLLLWTGRLFFRQSYSFRWVNTEAAEPEILLVAVKLDLIEGLVHAVEHTVGAEY